jgi:hypothetical protein
MLNPVLLLLVSHFRIFAEAVHPRAGLEITHVRVHAAVAVVAPGAFHCAAAAGLPVVVVTHTVSVELGALAFRLPLLPRRVGATPSPAAATPAAVMSRRVLADGRSRQVGGALLHHLVPAVPAFSACEGWVPGEGAPGVLSEEAIYELAQDPAINIYSLFSSFPYIFINLLFFLF